MIKEKLIRKSAPRAHRETAHSRQGQRVRYQEGEGGSRRQHCEADCEVLSRVPDIERGVNVGNDDAKLPTTQTVQKTVEVLQVWFFD